jgi:hypothetical protein
MPGYDNKNPLSIEIHFVDYKKIAKRQCKPININLMRPVLME